MQANPAQHWSQASLRAAAPFAYLVRLALCFSLPAALPPKPLGCVQSAHALQPEPHVVLRLRLLAFGTRLTCATPYLCQPIGRPMLSPHLCADRAPALCLPTTHHLLDLRLFFSPLMRHNQGVCMCVRVRQWRRTQACTRTWLKRLVSAVRPRRSVCEVIAAPLDSLQAWVGAAPVWEALRHRRACCPTQNAPAHKAAVTPQLSWHTPVLCHRVIVCGSGRKHMTFFHTFVLPAAELAGPVCHECL